MIAKKKHLLLFTALCLGTAAPVAVQAQDDFKLERKRSPMQRTRLHRYFPYLLTVS